MLTQGVSSTVQHSSALAWTTPRAGTMLNALSAGEELSVLSLLAVLERALGRKVARQL